MQKDHKKGYLYCIYLKNKQKQTGIEDITEHIGLHLWQSIQSKKYGNVFLMGLVHLLLYNADNV